MLCDMQYRQTIRKRLSQLYSASGSVNKPRYYSPDDAGLAEYVAKTSTTPLMKPSSPLIPNDKSRCVSSLLITAFAKPHLFRSTKKMRLTSPL